MKSIFFYIALGFIGIYLLKNFWQGNQSSQQILQLLRQGKKLFLVDVREPAEFANGSVKGAINIPLGQINNRLENLKGKENIVVFCASGIWSGRAKNILEQNGHKNVINGGAWNSLANTIK
jgi:phage shock protein E